jgi:hypothetical protein
MDYVLETYQSSKTGGYLKISQDRFREINTWTFSHVSMGTYMFSVAEPDNIKVMLINIAVFELSSR